MTAVVSPKNTSAAPSEPRQAALRFNKFRWEEQYRLSLTRGEGDWKHASLVMALRCSCGTGEPESHVPVVWRRDKSLFKELGMSRPTYQKQRDALAEAGLLFEIPSGRGSRQTIKVLKHPGWGELEALRSALDAFDAYCERTGNTYLGWIRRALVSALDDRETATTAKAGGVESSTERCDDVDAVKTACEEQPKSSFGATEKSFRLSLYNIKRPSSDAEMSSNSGASHAREASATAPPSQKSRSREDGKHNVVDFEHVRQLKLMWLGLFAEYGRQLDEGAALRLAKAYAPCSSDPEDIPHGSFAMPGGGRELVDSRLMRLFGDGRGAGAVARFLLEDVDDWSPPANAEPPTASQPSVYRPKTSTDAAPSLEERIAFRADELTLSGLSYGDAVAQAEDELG